jgi:hypothetical protein
MIPYKPSRVVCIVFYLRERTTNQKKKKEPHEQKKRKEEEEDGTEEPRWVTNQSCLYASSLVRSACLFLELVPFFFSPLLFAF